MMGMMIKPTTNTQPTKSSTVAAMNITTTNTQPTKLGSVAAMNIASIAHIETEKKQSSVKKGDISPSVASLVEDFDCLYEMKTLRFCPKLGKETHLNPKNTDRDIWGYLLSDITNSFFKTVQHLYLMTKSNGFSFASDMYLSKKLGLHPKTIRRHRVLAKAIGLIDWDVRTNKDQMKKHRLPLSIRSANKRTNLYRFCDDMKLHDGIYNLRDWAFGIEKSTEKHTVKTPEKTCAPHCAPVCAPLRTKRLKEDKSNYKKDPGFSEKSEETPEDCGVFTPPDEGPPDETSVKLSEHSKKRIPTETPCTGRSSTNRGNVLAKQEKANTGPEKGHSKAFCVSQGKNSLAGLPSCLDLTSPKAIEYCREKKLDKTRARDVLMKDAYKQTMLLQDGDIHAKDAITVDVMNYWLRWVSPEQLFYIISHDFTAYSRNNKVFSRNLLIQSMIRIFILNKHKSYTRWKGLVAKSVDQETSVCSGLKKEVDETSNNNFNEMAENHKFAMQKLRGIAGVRYSNSTNMFILPNFHIARLTLDDPMFKAKVLDFVRKNKTSAQKS